MKTSARILLVTLVLVVAGAVFLKGYTEASTSNPTASVLNGAPRGLLGLRLFFAERQIPVERLAGFDDELPAPAGHVLLIPPPERTAWTDPEARVLLARVEGGEHVVVACDDEGPRTERLKALLDALGAECFRADVPIGDTALHNAAGVLPGYAWNLSVRGTGRVRPRPGHSVVPAYVVGSDALVLRGAVGSGTVTVLGSATVLANDGLAAAENAAFALRTLSPRSPHASVLVDERHHTSRSRAAVLAAAGTGTGPLTGLAALALLVPLSLLALAPRPGDPPRPEDLLHGAPAAEAQALALASLLAVQQRRAREIDRGRPRRRSSRV